VGNDEQRSRANYWLRVMTQRVTSRIMCTGFERASIERSPSRTAFRRSNRLYYGVYSTTFTMDNIRNEIEGYLMCEESNKDLENPDWLQSQRFDTHKGIQEMMEAERMVLIGLFSERPMPVF